MLPSLSGVNVSSINEFFVYLSNLIDPLIEKMVFSGTVTPFASFSFRD
jgi:hypothetical protein